MVPCIWILQAVIQFARECSLGKMLSKAQEPDRALLMVFIHFLCSISIFLNESEKIEILFLFSYAIVLLLQVTLESLGNSLTS